MPDNWPKPPKIDSLRLPELMPDDVDPDFARDMELAYEVMRRYWYAFAELARL